MRAIEARGWRLLVPALVLASACSTVFAHGEGPPPPPSPPPPPTAPQLAGPATLYSVYVERILPARWSWLHWWEANRDGYLQQIRQGRGQKMDANVVAQYRSQAQEALRRAIKDPAWEVRMWAATAMGQMGDANALSALAELVKLDKQEAVVRAAIIAIGLLDSPEGEKALTTTPTGDAARREALLCALGLMSRPGPDTIVGLQKALEGADPGQAAVAAWALRRHGDPANTKFLADVLLRASSPWLASEALLCLGAQGQAESAAPLAEVLLATPGGKNLPAFRELDDRYHGIMRTLNAMTKRVAEQKVLTEKERQQNAQQYQKEYAEYEKNYTQYQKNLQDWNKKNSPNLPAQAAPKSPDLKEAKPANVATVFKVGLEMVYMVRLQASAAIALGNIDAPKSREALLKCLEAEDDGYSQVYKGFAMISLGRLGEERALAPLGQFLARQKGPGVVKTQDDLKSPLRGYAAIALGLYARPVVTVQGTIDRPNYDKVCLALAERVADKGEELEVRCASTVALGLTGRTENLRLLQAASANVFEADETLVGYMLMARGMLGDRGIIKACKQFLGGTKDSTETGGILARRAAVIGLALTGSQEAIPVLVDAWNLSYHSNREVTLALALTEAYNVTDPLVKLIKEATNQWERAFAARSLGDLFASERPQRLSWLIGGANYTFKNSRLMPYQAMANEFLYLHLLPLFGDSWR